MSIMLEPSPQQIKEEKIYREMGLTDEEFANVEKILGRTPNYTETGLFLLCGQSIAAIKIQSQY